MTEHQYNSTTTTRTVNDSYFLPHNNNKPSPFHESTPLYDLQQVIQQYQSQPELLKLILTSKVEEDKRRAEEAKLRAKELDLYLKNSNQAPSSPPTTPRPSISDTDESSPRKSSTSEATTLPSKTSPKLSSSVLYKRNNSHRGAPYVIPNTTTTFRSYHSSISSASSISSLSEEDMDEDEVEEVHNSDHHYQQRRHSAAAAMLAMGNGIVEQQQDDAEKIESNNSKEEEERKTVISSAYPSPVADQYPDEQDEFNNSKPRRRREMQAITKIVETRDFPYIDKYFWKNNGNTVQKKTGCKSIYYKCSNSNKGCSVNKTVTAKPNGEYLIKYRGCHLPVCGRVERIRDL